MIKVFWFCVVFILVTQVYGVFDYVSNSVKYQSNPDLPNDIDMVVVLTGSAGRINAAYDLMKKKDIRVLLVSGVDPQVRFEDLATQFGLEDKYKDRLEIDKTSTTTLENAKIAAEYVVKKNIKKMVLVTSIYHIQRAAYLFDKVLAGTGVQLFTYSFYNSPIDTDTWWNSFGVFKNIFSEYLKFRYYQILFKIM